MSKKLFMMSLATAVAVPAMVVPFTQNVEASQLQFKDISKTSPYYTPVTEMVSKGIIMGYNDGTYKPQTEITRVQVAMLLSRAIELTPVREAKEFKDVPKTYKHHDAIQKVQQAGIIDGAGNGNFNPEEKLTRSQMAKILAVAFNLEIKSTEDFPDVPESHWANKHVRALYSNGITVGNNGMYEPDESVTRGQYALFMYRLMNLNNESENPSVTPEEPSVTPEEPSVKPEEPSVKPEEPSVTPEEPSVTPEEPSVTPEEPSVTPEEPSVKPEEPSVKPEETNRTNLITDEYESVSDVPKPEIYNVETDRLNDFMLGRQANAMGFSNEYEFSVKDTDVSKKLDIVAERMGIEKEDAVKNINSGIENGYLVAGENYVLFYDYSTGIVKMKHK